MMKLNILALLIHSAVTLPRLVPGPPLHGCPSGCYSKSVLKTGLPGSCMCASTREENVKPLTNRASKKLVPDLLQNVFRSEPPETHFDISPHRYGRRTVAAMISAGALGIPLGYSWAAPGNSEIKLVTFDDAKGTTQKWAEVDDSTYIEGGLSAGKTSVSNGMLTFSGNVAPGRKFQDPGFIISRTGGEDGEKAKKFPDASSCEGISFVAKSTTPYKGYSFSISNKAGNGYKARFAAPLNQFDTVRIPFKEFTSSYSIVTGDPIKTCKESEVNCISFSPENLSRMESVAFWAEGVAGKVHLEVKEINAYGCNEASVSETISLEMPTSFPRTNGSYFLCHLSIVAAGLLIFFVVRAKKRPTPSASPLLR